MNTLDELKNYYFEKQYIVEKLESLKQTRKFLNTLKGEDDFNMEFIEGISEIKENEYKNLKDILEKLQNIENKVKLVEYPYRSVLYYRYIKGFDFKRISQKLNYSLKRIYQLHKEALIKYQNISTN